MAEEIAFENGQISNFEGLVTLTFDRVIQVILHTVVHHSWTSNHMPNFTEVEETFCGQAYTRTYGRTDGRLTAALLGRLCQRVNLKTNIYRCRHRCTHTFRFSLTRQPFKSYSAFNQIFCGEIWSRFFSAQMPLTLWQNQFYDVRLVPYRQKRLTNSNKLLFIQSNNMWCHQKTRLLLTILNKNIVFLIFYFSWTCNVTTMQHMPW